MSTAASIRRRSSARSCPSRRFATRPRRCGWPTRTPFGLSASLWTHNLARAHRVAERLEVGTVWVNCWLLRDLRTPFGGIKNSGVGREGGDEAMRFFTEPKTVCVKFPSEAVQ